MSKKATTKDHLKNALNMVAGLLAQFVAAADEDVGQVQNALNSHTGSKNNPHGVTTAQVGAVPTSRKVNNKALSADISLTASDVGALPSSGGTLTGNLTGKYITGTWLQTTTAGHMTASATKIPALDAAGWIYYRTPEELLGDLGGAKKGVYGTLTIPASGWGSDSTATYPKYYDIAVSGVTASDHASVEIAPAALGTAVSCGMCPACETLAGKIRIRAATVPTAAITANYWVDKS